MARPNTKPGKRKELIAHVDLPSTWLEAAGIPQPKKMQGRSFLPLLTGSGTYTPREAVFSERNWHDNYDPIRSVRTVRYKLIFNAQPNMPYRPIADLRDSPTWASYLALARRASRPTAICACSSPYARSSNSTTWKMTRTSSTTWQMTRSRQASRSI